ncbi:hypothetical protein [Actinomadura fibrosa]|uniref:Uncharacterized protein n=1 Tax=Actinomadura fibrosa TaxID=111802 RepID=A0ABW2Y6D7_9ACTN|nr:hypothetical protein [Actinomadura fibrosa]
MTAISASDVWALGRQGDEETLPDADLSHWNGRNWVPVSLPGAGKSVSLRTLSASSPTNVWVVGSVGGKQIWWHWNGEHWSTHRDAMTSEFEGSGTTATPYAVGTDNAWWFAPFDNIPSPPSPDVRLFNGRSWRKITTPGWITSMSASSNRDVWAVGDIGNEVPPKRPFLARWNGTAWTNQPLPKIAKGLEIMVRTTRDVWLLGEDLSGKQSLDHWDGRKWNRVALPDHWAMDELTDDGAGGLWLATRDRQLRYLYHYESGKWTAMQFPIRRKTRTIVYRLAHIPGTSSVWAATSVGHTEKASSHAELLKCVN